MQKRVDLSRNLTKKEADARALLSAEDSLSVSIIEQLNSGVSDQVAQAAKRSLDSFEVFGQDVMGHHDKIFHRELRRMLQRERHAVALLPRGFGKSTITAVEYPLWRLARNRDIRIIIATSAQRLGVEWLREIEWHMVFNEKYKTYFGDMVPDRHQSTWTDTEKIVLGRTSKATHTSLYVIGLGGSALGKRADVLIADDIFEPDEVIPNETTIAKIREWFFKIFYPIMEPSGCCFVIGTRFHPADLYGEMVEKLKWPALVQRALDDSERSTWPERFPTEELKARREAMGSAIFNLQYQNSVTEFGGSLLKADWLQTAMPEQIPPDLLIYQGIDPAFATHGGADYFVIFTIGYHEATRRTYLLDLIRTRVSPMQGVELIKSQASVWRPRAIGIETNAAQILLKDYLNQETDLNIIAVPSATNKITRFLHMASIFESGRVYMKASAPAVPLLCLQPFISEWLGFPNTKNDDTLDALEKAMSIAIFGNIPPSSGVKETNIEDETRERRSLIFGHQRFGQRLFTQTGFRRGWRPAQAEEEGAGEDAGEGSGEAEPGAVPK